MAEIELKRRIKYAGDVHAELLKAGWDCCTAAEFLNNIPDAADVAPVRHGYWRPILHKDGKTDYECSCCLGIIMDVPDDYEHDLCAWCSMCGAKMNLK